MNINQLKNKSLNDLIYILEDLNKRFFFFRMFNNINNSKNYYEMIKKFKKYISIVKLNIKNIYGK